MVIHEFGHLVAARYCEIEATELGLGLGPKLFGFNVGKVRFSVRAYPIGSFVLIDGSTLKTKRVSQQLLVHLGGIILNLTAGCLAYGTVFGWLNLLLAAGNLLPLYQHDGWKCGVVIVRAVLQRQSQPFEWAFTWSGSFVSLAIAYAVIRIFV